MTGDTTDPFPGFAAHPRPRLPVRSPATPAVTAPNPDNPFPIAQADFYAQKNTFGKDEAQDIINRQGGLSVVGVLGRRRRPQQAGVPEPRRAGGEFTGAFAVLPGVTIAANPGGAEFQNGVPIQQDWVRSLPPGKFRPMQRTGKKFFIYPDASRNQIYVGGPAEYDAYRQLHPEEQRSAQSAQDAAAKESAYRGKQAAAMQAATARDLSDPFLGASWADLGW